MGWGYGGWAPYVPVAQRRAKAAKELAKIRGKGGAPASPVVLEGKKIATTFWGKAWCDNLEAYSDFANRLPRGRTYVRNGSVVDLQIQKGSILSRVAGSSLYRIEIRIKPLGSERWDAVQKECAGKIDSLIELLQGRLSSAVMAVVTRRETGLFPTPKEIEMKCSCPDWAGLCKHLAATLYGVGARLDKEPALLFSLRGVDPADLISQVSAAEAVRQTDSNAPAMSDSDMADVFGIELESRPAPSAETGDPVVPTSKKPAGTQKLRSSKGPKPATVAKAGSSAPVSAAALKAKVKLVKSPINKAKAKTKTVQKKAVVKQKPGKKAG